MTSPFFANLTPFVRSGFIVPTSVNNVDSSANSNANNDVLTESVKNAFIVELANLGFSLEPDSVARISDVSIVDIEHNLQALREIVGSDRDMTPVYPGFPTQVQQLSTETLLVEQILHYLSGGLLIPDYPDVIREGLSIKDALVSAKKLKIVSLDELSQYVWNEVIDKTVAYSQNDKDMIVSFFALVSPELSDIEKIYVHNGHNENMQFLAFAAMSSGSISARDVFMSLAPLTSQVQRLLRLYLALFTNVHPKMGNKDFYDKAVFHLAGGFHDKHVYKLKVPNAVARLLVEQLGKIGASHRIDDVVKYKNMWRAILRHVHGFSYAKTSESKEVLDVIFDNVSHKTVNAYIEIALEDKDVTKAVDLLVAHKGGEFLRRINHLVRIASSNASNNANNADNNVNSASTNADIDYIVSHVFDVAKFVPLTTLVSVYNAVLNVNDTTPRLIRVPGHKNHVLDRERALVPDSAVVAILAEIEKAIVFKLSRVDIAGIGADNVSNSVDNNVGNVTVGTDSTIPISLVNRDVALTDSMLKRGSVLNVDIDKDVDTLRFFSHWAATKEINGYLDLGVIFLDKDFNKVDALSWNSWNEHRDYSTYSGDMYVHAGNNIAEYFDIDIPKFVKAHPEVKYLAATLQSYSGHPLNKLDMISGLMVRSEPDSGQPFEPRNVASAFKSTTDALQALPYVFDIDKSVMVWLDSSTGSDKSGMSATHDNLSGHIVRDELRQKMTYGHLAELFAYAHTLKTDANMPANVDMLDKLLSL